MNPSPAPPFDLDAYCERIGYQGPRDATLITLQGVQFAHTTRIPFENIDIRLGLPVHLDIASLQAKLVRAGRGGYCFEHNLLLAAALEALGFEVRLLAANVRLRLSPLPLTAQRRPHICLRVQAEGAAWLADAASGGCGLLHPLRLEEASVTAQGRWACRLRRDGRLWVLQTLQSGQWTDGYDFDVDPPLPPDFVLDHRYASTDPGSRFTQLLVVARNTADARYLLRGREFCIDDGRTQTVLLLDDSDDERGVVQVLAQHFGLRLPARTKLPL